MNCECSSSNPLENIQVQLKTRMQANKQKYEEDEIEMGLPNGAFIVRGQRDFMTEEWFLSDKHSTGSKLVFIGYDANLFPTVNFSERPKSKWNQKVIDRALEFTKDFDGEVWLDDYKVK